MIIKFKSQLSKTIKLPSFEGDVKVRPLPTFKLLELEGLAKSLSQEKPDMSQVKELILTLIKQTDIENVEDFEEVALMPDVLALMEAVMEISQDPSQDQNVEKLNQAHEQTFLSQGQNISESTAN